LWSCHLVKVFLKKPVHLHGVGLDLANEVSAAFQSLRECISVVPFAPNKASSLVHQLGYDK